MRRLLAFATAIVLLAPAALALAMVVQVPASAYAVPRVQVATAGEPVVLDPDQMGARRTERGFEVDAERIDAALQELAGRVAEPPVPAAYEMTAEGVVLDHGLPGRALDVDAARQALVEAFSKGRADVTLPVVDVPAPPPEQYAILVRLSELRLDLYEGVEHRKRYVVGIGKLNFPTPPGAYYIRSKARNPTWNNPGSPWARGMPRQIPPGPRNPLGTRALRLDRGALVIHGTPDQSSVGRRSSHGCVRMYRQDVEELFEIVPVGTPVFIIP